MTVYHGGGAEVRRPDLSFSRAATDFGRGFYVTPLYDQARKWSARFGASAVVCVDTLDEAVFTSERFLDFDSYSEEWLDFILQCRRGLDKSDWAVVRGGVANDKIFNTIELYTSHLIDKTAALSRLKYEKPNLQIALRIQEVIDRYLRFEKCEREGAK